MHTTSNSLPMLEAIYFDGHSAKKWPVTITLLKDNIRVEGEGVHRQEPFTPAMLSSRLGNAPRQLHFNDGACCVIQDHAAFEKMLEDAGHQSRFTVSVLESHWRYAIIALLLTAAAIVAAYIWALPVVANEVAKRIPAHLTAQMDQQTLLLLDKTKTLQPSILTLAEQRSIRDQLSALKAPAGQTKPEFELIFRNSEAIGPNAFALPGGTILVTDQLVKLANQSPADARQVIGVLTHELGHIYHRHALRQFVQGSIVAVVMTWYLGDISSLLATVPTAMLQTKYSRELENQADDYALHMLQYNHISPSVLADMLMKLERHYAIKMPEKKDSKYALDEYFSTHPLTQARIKKLQGQHVEK